jgi:hypothetical protein
MRGEKIKKEYSQDIGKEFGYALSGSILELFSGYRPYWRLSHFPGNKEGFPRVFKPDI